MSDDASAATLGRREVVLAGVAVFVVLTAGVFANAAAVKNGLKYQSLFFEQFNAMELPAMALIALFTLAVVLLALLSKRGGRVAELEQPLRPITLPRWGLPALIVLVAAVIVLGFFAAFHHYYIADDEYSAWFQAHIFAHGAWIAHVPPQWCGFITSITPTTIGFPQPCTWRLSILPGHSLVRAPFLALHADWLGGPVVAAVSLVLMFSIARKLWPELPGRAWFSVGILAASTQLLFMSMTMFSMSTHLLFALVWLWLYADNRVWAIALLPLASFCAFAAHSPTPHLFWVAPFILRYALQRRWAAFCYVAVGLVIAGLLCAPYLGIGGHAAVAGTSAGATVASSVTAPTHAFAREYLGRRWSPFVMAMNLTLIATWNSPIVIVALTLGLLAWSRQDGFVKTCTVSLVVTILLREITGSLQGEGFGYRFVYDNLGEIALICVYGVEMLAAAIGAVATRRLLIASAAATVLIQLPMRFWQVDRFAAPWARTYAWLASQPAKVVVFNPGDVMWGRQLLRNDPFFEHGPVLVSESQLPKDGLEKLRAMYPGQVRIVSSAELMQFGLERQPLMFGSLRVGP